MRSFTKEQFRAAIMHRSENITRDSEQMEIVKGNALNSAFLIFRERYKQNPRDTFDALFLYGMNIAYTINELECEPGDFHCLEHKEKNCTCACTETTSQVGKLAQDEGVNPAGPRYF